MVCVFLGTYGRHILVMSDTDDRTEDRTDSPYQPLPMSPAVLHHTYYTSCGVDEYWRSTILFHSH
jgi:hypothetical protein